MNARYCFDVEEEKMDKALKLLKPLKVLKLQIAPNGWIEATVEVETVGQAEHLNMLLAGEQEDYRI